MQVKLFELERHLDRTLAPIYVVSGDEPLQCEEALDRIRESARARGHDERVRMEAGKGFDWSTLQGAADSLSLFTQKRILDLRMSSGKPGDAGSKALIAYVQHPSPDNVLIISTGKLDPATRRTKWYRAVESAGVSVQVWPVDAPQLAAWIRERGARLGVRMTTQAAELLGERVEGNLLACAQEIDMLALLYPSITIDPGHIMGSVGDSARFSIFDCVESALQGNARRVLRISQGLAEEGTEPVLLNWAFAREIRLLESVAAQAERGLGVERALDKQKLWEKRKRPLAAALARHPAKRFRRMLRRLAVIDRIIKGAAPGNAWDELTRIGLGLAGVLVLRH